MSALSTSSNVDEAIVTTPPDHAGVGAFARVAGASVIFSLRLGIDVLAIADSNGATQTLSHFAEGETLTPAALVSDGTRAYWAEAGAHGAVRSWAPGEATPRTIANDETYPFAVAVDDENVYWTSKTGVWSHAK
jgi:hypothetical protein